MGRTLAEKVWDAHVVRRAEGEPDLLYIDLHLVHEVTSPQAFDGLRLPAARCAGPTSPSPPRTTTSRRSTSTSRSPTRSRAPRSRRCAATAPEFGVRLHSLGDVEQGIVHVVGPQLGLTQPGMTIVCGDSHTSTHGAFGALAFGIGTSEVEHVLATQTLPLKPFKTMAVTVDGRAARRASPPRTSSSRSSPRSAPAAARATSSSTAARPSGAVDGGADDDLQHVDRGRRPRRHDRPGRDDLRLPRGPAARAEGRADWDARSPTGARCAPTTTRSSTPRSCSTPTTLSRSSPGAPTPARACRWAARARPRGLRRRGGRARRAERALEYMGLTPARRCARSPSTPSSSARAPTAGSRTCAPRPRSSRAAGSPTASGCSSCPARPRAAAGRGRGPRPVFKEAGAEWRDARAARCAWA
jgi:hypothetical protein